MERAVYVCDVCVYVLSESMCVYMYVLCELCVCDKCGVCVIHVVCVCTVYGVCLCAI